MAGLSTTTKALRSRLALYELRSITQNATKPHHLRAPASSTPPLTQGALRSLHTTNPRNKKSREPGWDGSKTNPKRTEFLDKRRGASKVASSLSPAIPHAGDSSDSKHPTPSPEDPLDFADVRSRLTKHDEQAQDLLKKLKSGGRFNPDMIGALKVQPDRKEPVAYPLRELAQIVPRGGRTISLLVHEEASIKPIMSAIQGSADFNQQPQRSPDNELELILKMEMEKREDIVKRAKGICHEWRERVRQVRQKRDKLHATWKKDGSILPDLKKRADTELEKIIKAKMAAIDAAEKEAIKAAEK